MKKILFQMTTALLLAGIFASSCKKNETATTDPQSEETRLEIQAQQEIQEQQQRVTEAENEMNSTMQNMRGTRTIAGIVTTTPFFHSLTAAVVKTGLAPVLASAELNATVFAPTDRAFAKLPAPFNNAASINAITNPAQIEALKNILLYHVLGSEVKRRNIARNRSRAETLKPQTLNDDNDIFLSNSNGLLLVNGNSLVLLADVDASNGVIHIIDDVLLPPSQNIAQIAIGNPNFSTLVAALVKTDLAGVFTGSGDFTVFAPTNDAFSKLPAPFNNAANIGAISDPAQIAALANILKYHVSGSRYFCWDLGILQPIGTLAAAPNNQLVGVLGLNNGWIKGRSNNRFSRIAPGNLLATNGVINVIDQVLLP
jgi:uncharacterized surface protein with fasciclin (FAS1) repeats